MGIEDGVPEEAPPVDRVDDDGPFPSTDQRKKRNLKLIGVAAAVVIFMVLVGILIGSNNGSDGSKSGSKSLEGGDPTAAPVAIVPEPTANEPTAPDPTASPVEPEVEVFFESDVGPFKNLQVPLQTSKIQIYSDEDEVRGDLETMSRFLLNNVAERGLGNPHFADAAFGSPNFAIGGQEPGTEGGRDEQNDSGGDDGDGDGDDNKDSFLTNNQEDGVDEADIAKSDGKFIFSLLGKYLLVVLASTDELVVQIELPAVDVGDITIPGMDIPEPEPGIFPSSDIMPPGGDAYVPQSFGQALLLSESTLAVVAGGYAQGNYYRQGNEPDIIMQKGGTLLQLFSLEKLYSIDDFSAVDKEDVLTVVGEKYLNGEYLSGYMIGSVAVVATTSYVYNEGWLVRPFERWAPQYSGTTNEEYLEAMQQDSEEAIAKYIDKLLSELEISPGVMPDIVKLALPTSSLSETDEYTNAEFGNGYANFMLQIATVDMESPSMLPQDDVAIEAEEAPELDVKALVQFMSHTWAICYATTNDLIVIGQGYNFNMRWQASEDTSMLYQYDIQGVNITPKTTGSVPGTVSSKHWIDSVGDEVRIGTTKRQWIPFNVEGGPIIIRAGQQWQGGFDDGPEVTVSGAADSVPEMTAKVVDPDGPNDLARLEDCTDLPSHCIDEATGLVLDGMGDCDAVAAECPAGMFFMSINDCQFHCETDFADSQCVEYVSLGLDEVSPCITGANLMDCLSLDSNGCELIMPFETCPLQFECIREAPNNATIAPEVTSKKFIPVFDCQDAATVECPLDVIIDTCQRFLGDGCEETYMGTADCNFFCRDSYDGTMCAEYFDMVVSEAISCPLSHVSDCANFLELGCDIAISSLDMCEFDIRCDAPNATAAPEVASEFIQVLDCQDASAFECPLDATLDTCQHFLDGSCEETYMTADCNFFCRDAFVDTICLEYFDMVVSGAINCPLSHASECAHFVEQGCDITVTDLDMCEFDIQCGVETPAPDLLLLQDCSMVDESCLDGKFETVCSDMASSCGEMFYSNSTCQVYCLDSMGGGICGQYAHTALYEGNVCIDGIALAECLSWEIRDCMVVGLGLCPESFDCIIDNRETPPPTQLGCPSVGEGCMDEASVNECLQLEEDGCEEIMIDRDMCEVTCFSRTENNLFVLKDNEGQLEITGSVQFGKTSEEITSILFRDTRAFAVTFLRRDPLYIIDLNDPTDPKIIGALDIPGFSSYLYPINDASTLLLGIGQHADPITGNNEGLKLSIFDVEDPNTMAERWSYHDGQQWSSAEFDDKAWRYLADGDGKGTLIIPIARSGTSVDGMYEWFDGFGVFSVDSDIGIEHLYDIDHVQDPDQCYVCHQFTMRSFVIDGNIITQKGRSFASTGLTSGTPNWILPLLLEANADGDTSNCCGWFMVD